MPFVAAKGSDSVVEKSTTGYSVSQDTEPTPWVAINSKVDLLF